MNVILILILASLAMALLFLGGFFWAVRSGQFDDTFTPSMRVLTEEPGKLSKHPGKDQPKNP
jgi:cbb3-type cytochrome oxidase maturation protein